MVTYLRFYFALFVGTFLSLICCCWWWCIHHLKYYLMCWLMQWLHFGLIAVVASVGVAALARGCIVIVGSISSGFVEGVWDKTPLLVF